MRCLILLWFIMTRRRRLLSVMETGSSFFMSKDPEMKTYCAEIDPKGKVMDYEAHNYRKFDFNWNFKDLKLATSVGKDSYRVEGSISLKTLRKLGLISPEGEIRMGVYRADYFDDAGGARDPVILDRP